METQGARMYNSDTELLFPLRVIPSLKNLRGEEWKALIDQVTEPDCDFIEQMAFVMMMVKLSGCVVCNGDSFRAMRGCTQCARQSVKRYKGSDQDLIEQISKARRDIEGQLNKNAIPSGDQEKNERKEN
jgi:hypothetical protein